MSDPPRTFVLFLETSLYMFVCVAGWIKRATFHNIIVFCFDDLA